MPRPGTVIIGAGLAGLRCATSLRRLGYVDQIHLVGDEAHLPYERPPLSKALLAGTREPETLAMTSQQQLTELDIELYAGARVTTIDPAGSVRLDDGTIVPWARLVFASGARARTLPGAEDHDHVLTLRTIDDALALRTQLADARSIAIVGCGFVGAEVASTALDAGIDVTMVELASAPFEHSLGREIGAILVERYRAAGVDVRLDVGSVRVAPDGRGVDLERGGRIAADVVLVGIGAIPNDELFHDTFGGAAGRGIAVDGIGRTAVPAVHACGDVAAGPGGRREHWTCAAASGESVARDITGAEQPPTAAPYAWSDQFGMRLQVVGATGPTRATEIVDPAPESMQVHYLDESGMLVGGVASNRPKDVASWRRELAG